MAAHRFIEALLDHKPLTVFGDGGQVRDFTYVDDVVDATIRALSAELPRAAVLDIASSAPVDVSTMITHLRSLTSADDVPVDRVAERRGDVPRTAGDTAAAQSRLGWAPKVDLATGLARQVAWHRSLRGQPAVDGLAASTVAAPGGDRS
jgi:nucleoside-diphosphate-sugar epimerase